METIAFKSNESGGRPDLDLTYDKAGNIRTQEVGAEATPTVITDTHDLWTVW